jgi:phospholipid-binding lipoprotein MlaA
VRPWNTLVGFLVFAVALTGCGTVSQRLTAASSGSPQVNVESAVERSRADIALVDAGIAIELALAAVAAPIPMPETIAPAATRPEPVARDVAVIPVALDANDPPLVVVAQAPAGRPPRGDKDDYDVEEYDPWEPFNEAMFNFNLKILDRYVLKPVAKGWDKVVPDEVQRMLDNAFDNLGAPKRFVNSLLQGKWDGAVREFSRFMLNTTVGMGGLFEMSKAAGIQKSREDFGQTLGFYGVGPGPFLVLPFYAPSTVRDFIGTIVDGFLNPLRYIVPSGSLFFDAFVDPVDYLNDSWRMIVIDAGETVNDRSLNLELFQGFEETVIDMYSAVRHAYLERRRNMIKE